MRRVLLACGLAGLLVLAVGVLYALGRLGLEAERRRLRAEAAARRQADLLAARQELADALAELVAREERRPYYHYQVAYVPPDVVATQTALVPSPLAEAPTEPLVRFYFEYRGGAFSLPAHGGAGSATASALVPSPATAPDGGGAAPLARLRALAPSCERTLRQSPERPAREAVVDELIASYNRNLDKVVALLGQAQREREAGESSSASAQRVLSEDWLGYLRRGGNAPARFDAQKKARPKGGLRVRLYPFVPLRAGSADGWPEELVYVRRVEVGAETWLQGFAVDLERLRGELLPRILARAADAKKGQPAPGLRKSLSSVPRSPLTVVPTSAARGRPSLPLAPPLQGVALAWRGPLPDPARALRGSELLLHGALALALLALAVGGGIARAALRGERRLARQRADFVAALTHELKAPLAGVRALAEVLHDGLVEDPDKQREYFATMLAECDRLGRLVQNVLGAARLERGLPAARREALDPRPLLEDIAGRFAPRLETAGVRFEIDLPSALPEVRADAVALEHIVVNLLDNAAKYGKGEASEACLRARPEERGLAVEVLDRGPGVPADEREAIFARFARGTRAPREIGGAGLGLAIARAHAVALGGTLEALERPGGGARFRLWLPLAGESS